MPALVAIFAPLIGIVLRVVILKIIAMLGISLVAYIGISQLTDGLFSSLFNALDSVAPNLLNWLALFGVDQFLQILMNAFTAALTIKIAMGAFSKLSFGVFGDS